MIRFITSLVVLVAASSLFAQAPWSYYTPEQEKEIRAKLPTFEDKVLQKRLEKAVLYDSTVLPGVFFDTRSMQSKNSGAAYSDDTDLVRLDFNLSISAEDPIGNPNNEEPWKNTAGLPTKYPTIKAILLPEVGDIDVWFAKDSEHSQRVRSMLFWEYPVGTTILEFMQQKFTDGEEMTFNVRQRVKVTKGSGVEHWGKFDQYRPIRNSQELHRTLFQTPSKATPVFNLEDMRSRHHDLFPDRKAAVLKLPKLEMKTSKLMLKLPFKSTVGEPWFSDGKVDCDMAETDHEDSIVPLGYQGAHFIASKKSCSNCHSETKRYAFDLENPRQWYGYVRGDDGIFSWHPVGNVPGMGQMGRDGVILDERPLRSGRVKFLGNK